MARTSQVHSTFPLDAPLISDDTGVYEHFLQDALLAGRQGLVEYLRSIPHPNQNSYGALATLSALLSAIPGPWPITQLQLAYSRAWKALPEAAKAGHASPQAHQLLDWSLRQCKQSYASLIDLFHSTSPAPAIIDPERGQSIRHDALAH